MKFASMISCFRCLPMTDSECSLGELLNNLFSDTVRLKAPLTRSQFDMQKPRSDPRAPLIPHERGYINVT